MFFGSIVLFWFTKDQFVDLILHGKKFFGRSLLIQTAISAILTICYFCILFAIYFVFSRYILRFLPDKIKTRIKSILFKIKRKKIRKNILLIVSLAILSFIFLLNSPLHPWINSDSGTDSGVFQTVALMMDNGFMPYKDTFDHKGPLIYIINWFGNKISEENGIWVIELVSLTIVFFFLYRIAKLKCRTISSLLISLISTSLLFEYFDGGNFTEEYAMLFISVSLFIFLDYLLNKRINRIRLITCGFCLGSVFLLRPNMISVWVVFCTLIFFQTFIKKEWEVLKKFLFWFVIGICIICIPIFIWLSINKALIACWEDYIVFNLTYTSYEDFAGKWNSFIMFFKSTVNTISISICTIAILDKQKKEIVINISYLVYMVITLLFISLSGIYYEHYGMIIIPMVSYPLALLFNEIEKIRIEQIVNVISMITSLFFLTIVILPNWLSLISTIPNTFAERESNNVSEVAATITNIIENFTRKDEKISVCGNWDDIYVKSQRQHATKYSYQYPIGNISPMIMNQYMKELKEEQPKVIVVQTQRCYDNIIFFLIQNEYNLVWSFNANQVDGANVYVKQQKE